ncbi:hypothetical protein GCM10014715_78460 [Streptomyces spiralis]|uniref:DUF4352 domain-containing protein n=1 Tax=Streptomyces spiralis TaxID=66376 RepID=A0A919AI83_9ACTN|nr:hypothetical protein [Streptomyces spiralis]GHF11095.1 hypothetical protein GCM10014715_78460 [Streptomyces spiralis]
MNHDITPPPMPSYGPPVPPAPQPQAKRHRTVVIAVAAAVVAAAVSAAVTAGVTGEGDTKAAPTVTVTETVGDDSADAASDDTTAPADDATDDATDEGTGGDVYTLTDTVAYENDVAVSLSGFRRAVSSQYAAPENTDYVRFTVKIKNSGSKTLDTTGLTVNCSYGEDGHSSESIFDSEHGLDGGPDTKLLAGRSINVPWGCELPKAGKLIQIEVSPDMESESAIFTGTVK